MGCYNVGPYKDFKWIGKVSCELELSKELTEVYQVFDISLLKRCVGNLASIVPLKSMAVKYSLSNKDVPGEILNSQVRRL